MTNFIDIPDTLSVPGILPELEFGAIYGAIGTAHGEGCACAADADKQLEALIAEVRRLRAIEQHPLLQVDAATGSVTLATVTVPPDLRIGVSTGPSPNSIGTVTVGANGESTFTPAVSAADAWDDGARVMLLAWMTKDPHVKYAPALVESILKINPYGEPRTGNVTPVVSAADAFDAGVRAALGDERANDGDEGTMGDVHGALCLDYLLSGVNRAREEALAKNPYRTGNAPTRSA